MKKNLAELFGTFWLVLGGCGTAIFAGSHVGFLGIALAFGLTVLTMAFAVGHISGGHFNPAVTFGLWAAGKFESKNIAPYVVSQVIGGLLGATVIYFIASGIDGFAIDNTQAGAFASNGYGDFSPTGYCMGSVLLAEFILTFFFLLVILGSTSKKAPAGFAPIAIGLGLTLIHLIAIPISNTSVNPARSLSQAIFAGGTPLAQVWLFWVAPIAGAIVAGLCHKCFWGSEDKE
ncbi:MAG: aquaporin Z [Bacteroidales bacterium]